MVATKVGPSCADVMPTSAQYQNATQLLIYMKQAISASRWALCQRTVCFDFQSRSGRRKGHKNCFPQVPS